MLQHLFPPVFGGGLLTFGWQIMFGKLWNLLFFAGLAATAYSVITGRDITGVPTSVTTTECSDIADEFIGKEMTIDYALHKIQRVDRMEVLARTEAELTCRGLVYLEGSASSFVRLLAQKQNNAEIYVEIMQARPEDYDCAILAEEVTMKFRDESHGEFGTILAITNGRLDSSRPTLHCVGNAQFSSGSTLPMAYAYDGQRFTVGQ
jgi:hypothetical protein